MTRRDLAFVAGGLLLLALGIVRIALPDRSRLRPLSIQFLEVKSEQIDPKQTQTAEVEWAAPDDIYVLGWNPQIGAPIGQTFSAEVILYVKETSTALFIAGQRATPPGALDVSNPFAFPAGTGARVARGQHLLLRYRVSNGTPESWPTYGASALVYFVPVAGN